MSSTTVSPTPTPHGVKPVTLTRKDGTKIVATDLFCANMNGKDGLDCTPVGGPNVFVAFADLEPTLGF